MVSYLKSIQCVYEYKYFITKYNYFRFQNNDEPEMFIYV